MHNVSIIIVNYNGRQYLHDCLASIRQSDAAEAEIIVVDNGSIDGSLEDAQRSFPEISIIRMGRNSGFAEANDVGARSARCDYLVFLNNDTIVTHNWLSPLLITLTTDQTIGVVGSKLLFMDARDRIMSAGLTMLFNGTGYDRGFMERDEGQYDWPGARGAVCGAVMMVRRDEFLSVGGFDADYFLYAEDLDLCWRYWLFGYTVQYVPSSVVYHAFGGTAGPDRHTPLRVFYRVRNGCRNIIKNYELLSIPVPMTFNAVFHLAQSAFFLATCRWKSAWAVVKAYGDCIRTVRSILYARRAVQSRRVIRDRELFADSRIVSLGPAVWELFRLRRIAKTTAR
jgi:GT2 family glycosyltransferase